ncbi:hypothetical protein VTJ04DRAFT_9706 [Mycothermus thermophilus]|uniref:uncharacterized protein n=1 Tax=Humicola insolens TaxID=85995 RepID=UPI0037427EE3
MGGGYTPPRGIWHGKEDGWVLRDAALVSERRWLLVVGWKGCMDGYETPLSGLTRLVNVFLFFFPWFFLSVGLLYSLLTRHCRSGTGLDWIIAGSV